MKLCNEYCHPICDFCKFFSFKKGYCFFHKTEKTPIDWCDEFYCFLIKDEVNNENVECSS